MVGDKSFVEVDGKYKVLANYRQAFFISTELPENGKIELTSTEKKRVDFLLSVIKRPFLVEVEMLKDPWFKKMEDFTFISVIHALNHLITLDDLEEVK